MFTSQICEKLPTENYYDILNVNQSASPTEIGKAYQKKIKIHESTPYSEAELKLIEDAHNTLKDYFKKKKYDDQYFNIDNLILRNTDRCLIENKLKNTRKITPHTVNLAINSRDKALVELILKFKTEDSLGVESLNWAIQTNNIDIVNLILNTKYHFNINLTIITEALKTENPEIINKIEELARPIAYQLISAAVIEGNLEAINFLLKCNPEIDRNLLKNAIKTNREDIISLITNKSPANAEALLNDYYSNNDFEFAKKIILAIPNLTTIYLKKAIKEQKLSLVQSIVEKLLAVDDEYIMTAIETGHIGILNLIIAKGRVNKDHLIFAWNRKQAESLNILIIHSETSSKVSFLDHAISKGAIEILEKYHALNAICIEIFKIILASKNGDFFKKMIFLIPQSNIEIYCTQLINGQEFQLLEYYLDAGGVLVNLPSSIHLSLDLALKTKDINLINKAIDSTHEATASSLQLALKIQSPEIINKIIFTNPRLNPAILTHCLTQNIPDHLLLLILALGLAHGIDTELHHYHHHAQNLINHLSKIPQTGERLTSLKLEKDWHDSENFKKNLVSQLTQNTESQKLLLINPQLFSAQSNLVELCHLLAEEHRDLYQKAFTYARELNFFDLNKLLKKSIHHPWLYQFQNERGDTLLHIIAHELVNLITPHTNSTSIITIFLENEDFLNTLTLLKECRKIKNHLFLLPCHHVAHHPSLSLRGFFSDYSKYDLALENILFNAKTHSLIKEIFSGQKIPPNYNAPLTLSSYFNSNLLETSLNDITQAKLREFKIRPQPFCQNKLLSDSEIKIFEDFIGKSNKLNTFYLNELNLSKPEEANDARMNHFSFFNTSSLKNLPMKRKHGEEHAQQKKF